MELIAILTVLFTGAGGWVHNRSVQVACLWGLLFFVFLMASCFEDYIYIGRRKK